MTLITIDLVGDIDKSVKKTCLIEQKPKDD